MKAITRFTDIKNYAIGLVVEVAAVCILMLAAFLIGLLLMSWY